MGRKTGSLNRALALLGPLEGRIMREVWRGTLPERFFVRDVLQQMPDLAYTTVMTTVNRLAEKGLLKVHGGKVQRAIPYSSTGDPEAFLAESSRKQARELVSRYGDAAFAAFAAQLDELTPEQRTRLKALIEE